jgi:ribosome-binding factor A
MSNLKSSLELEKIIPQKTPVRQLRVAELIQHVVAEIFSQQQVNDDIINSNFITVSRVKVSPDLRNATIFITIFQDERAKELIARLNQLVPKFRFIISNNVKLKSSPQIIFRYDDTLEHIDRIANLLNK